MRYDGKEIDRYIQMYPKFGKWVHTCRLCGARGCKPEMPDCVGSDDPQNGVWNAKYLRSRLPILELDSDGLCSICSRLYREK